MILQGGEIMKVNYRVTLESPALTGQSGTIGKDIDIVTKRDNNNLPYFPASHIKGIYRDKVNYMLDALEGFSIEKFFGGEGENQTKLLFSNLDLCAVDGKPMEEKENALNAGYIIGNRHGIRVDKRTRTTAEGSLFNYEYINPQIEFKGHIEIDDKGEPISREEIRYLMACLLHIDKIGGQKSRGLGKVSVRIDDKAIERLEDIVDEYFNRLSKKEKEISLTGKNKSYKYTLKFEEDIILKSREVGNTTETLDYIHGGSIRGAIIEKISQLLSQEELNKVIGGLNVSQGIVENSFISPASIFRSKYEVDGKYKFINKVIKNDKDVKGSKGNSVKLERHSSRFVGAKLKKKNDVGVAIDKASRTSQDGMLFDKEILRTSGMVFEGLITLDEAVKNFLDKTELRIGKKKNKGFGRGIIKLEEISVKRSSLENRISKLNEKCVLDKKIITLDCLSDVILPFNEIESIGEELGELLNITGDFLGERSFVNVVKIGGYSLLNNIRKSDELVIEKGSVFTYEYKQDSIEDLKKLEENGIGLRKKEGFGKIEFCTSSHLKEEF
jgi:CRISPR/Cas system CSM-associated protein Csm3 (group 7 of RAMP superfamily)